MNQTERNTSNLALLVTMVGIENGDESEPPTPLKREKPVSSISPHTPGPQPVLVPSNSL